MQPSSNRDSTSTIPLLLRLLPLLVLVLGLGGFFALGLHRYIGLDSLRENRQLLLGFTQSRGAVAIVLFIAVYALAIALSIPGGLVLSITGGFLFGLWYGTLAVVTGATLGALGVFLAVRLGLGDSLTKRAGPSVRKMEQGFRENAFQYLLILRLIPIFPFFVVNIVPAIFGVSIISYLLATVIGIIPGTFAFVSVGSGIGAVFDAGREPDLSLISKPEVLIPIVSLVALALLQLVYKYVKKRKGGRA